MKYYDNRPKYPAFARAAFYHPDGAYVPPQEGLTTREYFSAIAMQGLLTRVPKRENYQVDLGTLESQRIAAESVIMADKLIEELNKPSN